METKTQDLKTLIHACGGDPKFSLSWVKTHSATGGGKVLWTQWKTQHTQNQKMLCWQRMCTFGCYSYTVSHVATWRAENKSVLVARNKSL
eukprot:5717225-Amphidinium_carterae.1